MLADVVPLYPLYAVWFVDSGLSQGRISALFALWSVVGILAEVPSGALADRFSRRGVLVAAGLLQAAGYGVWVAWPSFGGFAAGFVLWGLGGSFVSGAFEALLYDALAAAGAQESYTRLTGMVTAAGLLAQLPAAGLATVLFAAGGYPLVGLVSVGTCVAAAVLATRFPEVRPGPAGGSGDDTPAATGTDDDPGLLGELRAGISHAAARPGVRGVLLAVAVLAGFDAVEEYFPLLAVDWHVDAALVPLAVVATAVAGAAVAALGGVARSWRPWRIAWLMGGAALALGVAAVLSQPVGLVLVGLFYGGYRLVLVVVEARLQDRITGDARATVTSVAGLGTEPVGLALFGAWAAGGVVPVAVLGLATAAALPLLLRRRD